MKLKNDFLTYILLPPLLCLIFINNSFSAASIAIEGYDPVAYFTLHSAIKGNNQITHQWNEKNWHFQSPEHKKMFVADPEKYAPQFNGFCANGLSDGHAIEADPNNWRIIDGKLYLFFSDYGRDQWTGNVKPLLKDARETFQNH